MMKAIHYPDTDVLRMFRLQGNPTKLAGGQGTSWRIGESVVKTNDDEDEAFYGAQIMDHVSENGFRVAKPIKSLADSWTYKGWTAYQYVPGEHKKGFLKEKITTCKAFHTALRKYPKPNLLEKRTHVYAVADRMAWQEQALNVSDTVYPFIEDLQNALRPVDVTNQLIHGDFAGNVLFAVGMRPAVIDFSPYWRPADYALAILLVDALVWEHADKDILKDLAIPNLHQFMLRALLGRVLQFDLLTQKDKTDRMTEILAHKALAELLIKKTKEVA